jgi:sulfur-carrier protein adenylyltransferase/sulfurtransferase
MSEHDEGIPPTKEISVPEVENLLKETRRPLKLLDVREKSELVLGVIEGAQSIPASQFLARAETDLPGKDDPLVLYCASGVRSLSLTNALRDRGYTDVRSMTGGFSAWANAGLPVKSAGRLSPEQLNRYSRQILLPEIGEEGQVKLMGARVLIVGAGGLGSPAALYLAGAGVGTMGIVDFDTVDVTNLHRQILHSTAFLGRPKTESAADAITRINPELRVRTYNVRLTPENALSVIKAFDIVLDGSDNFPTKYLLNDACFFSGKPYIYGGAVRFQGQVSVFYPKGGGPCLRCMLPVPPDPGLVPT